ncbi:MAG: MgtC/SapB family protein [Faecalibacterium sp.]
MEEFTSLAFQGICILRLALAAGCGLCIGVERHNRLKEAGMRTHLLVCMGAALLMMVSKYGFFDVAPLGEFFKTDLSRIASNVVSGVGFLGAGMIFVRNRSITGLTTAAGIWVTAGIGLAVGAGLYLIAITGTLFIIAAQSILHNGRVIGSGMMSLVLRIDGRSGTVSQTIQQLQSIGAELVDLDIAQKKNDIIKIEMRVKPVHNTDQLTVIGELERLPWVLEVGE